MQRRLFFPVCLLCSIWYRDIFSEDKQASEEGSTSERLYRKRRPQKCLCQERHSWLFAPKMVCFFPVGAEVLVTDEEARTPGPRLLRRAADGADIKALRRRQTSGGRQWLGESEGREKWKQLAGRVNGDGAGADK